jgi:endoglucanase Acf2
MPLLNKTLLFVVTSLFLFMGSFFVFSKTETAKKIFKEEKTPLTLSETHSLKPILSNQWYSSLLLGKKSQPLYALPLAYIVSAKGLGFSLPEVVKTEHTIFAPYVEDFTVGFSTPLSPAKITTVGDWNIGIEQTTEEGSKLSYTLAHGVPYTILDTQQNDVIFTTKNEFTIYNNNDKLPSKKSLQTKAFVFSTRQHNYIVVSKQATDITITKNTVSIKNPQTLFIGILDKRSHFSTFLSASKAMVINTIATLIIEEKNLITTYTVQTTQDTPLIAVYPHQYEFLQNKPDILGSYNTIRGSLYLIKDSHFTTTAPLVIPAQNFSKLNTQPVELEQQVKNDTLAIISAPLPESKNYFFGTYLGKVITLIQLADTLGMENEKTKLLAFIKPLFLDALTYYQYDEKKTSLISLKPEFGNENLNDHHFHYGYYIRAAAILGANDKEFLEKTQIPVEKMVADIASTKRSGTQYPFLRNFDIYEGHSWADGYANFPDGNNQESSSEAMNAWYGVYLWSKVTNNTELEHTALYLYNTELQATYYYWFGENHLYTPPYTHAIASMIWGAKADFGTWFSSETNKKYGIILLPFTPASSYLGALPDFSKYEKDYKSNAGNKSLAWGDLFTMWKSFYNPTEAMKEKDTIHLFEENNTKSLFLYTLYKNAEKTTK